MERPMTEQTLSYFNPLHRKFFSRTLPPEAAIRSKKSANTTYSKNIQKQSEHLREK
jgi:hypothetical protein